MRSNSAVASSDVVHMENCSTRKPKHDASSAPIPLKETCRHFGDFSRTPRRAGGEMLCKQDEFHDLPAANRERKARVSDTMGDCFPIEKRPNDLTGVAEIRSPAEWPESYRRCGRASRRVHGS